MQYVVYMVRSILGNASSLLLMNLSQHTKGRRAYVFYDVKLIDTDVGSTVRSLMFFYRVEVGANEKYDRSEAKA